MKMQDKIVINDYIENDPLSEENLDKTLETADKIRLSLPNKSIWLYSGYTFDYIMEGIGYDENGAFFFLDNDKKRYEIISKCDVLVDGRYIDSQRNPSKKWAGSDNQRVIIVQESLKQGKVITLE